MGDLDTATTLSWMRAVAASIAEHEAELTALDAAIGDGDHGANLRRGFSAAAVAANGSPPRTPSPARSSSRWAAR